MIQPLRARHRRIFSVLAPAVALAYVAALSARRDVPVSDTSATALRKRAAVDGAWARGSAQWDELAIRARVIRSGEGWMLDLWPERDPMRPDVLVYACRASGRSEGLPADARLLGTLAGVQPRRFALPADLQPAECVVMLYSLGHGEVIGMAPCPPP